MVSDTFQELTYINIVNKDINIVNNRIFESRFFQTKRKVDLMDLNKAI